MEADIRNVDIGQTAFDLVHARYVLIHVQDYRNAFKKMHEFLKPGGWLVIEEPDFSAAKAVSGREELCHSFNKVNSAIEGMFTNLGMDYALGLRLPALAQEYGLKNLTVENEVPLVPGASSIASMMKLSAHQLSEKYLGTGRATADDIEAYCHFAEDPTHWGIYYSTIRIRGQKF